MLGEDIDNIIHDVIKPILMLLTKTLVIAILELGTYKMKSNWKSRGRIRGIKVRACFK